MLLFKIEGRLVKSTRGKKNALHFRAENRLDDDIEIEENVLPGEIGGELVIRLRIRPELGVDLSKQTNLVAVDIHPKKPGVAPS